MSDLKNLPKSAGNPPRRILIVSDGTGETAAQMAKAAMVQFGGQNVFFSRYKNIREASQLEAILED